MASVSPIIERVKPVVGAAKFVVDVAKVGVDAVKVRSAVKGLKSKKPAKEQITTVSTAEGF